MPMFPNAMKRLAELLRWGLGALPQPAIPQYGGATTFTTVENANVAFSIGPFTYPVTRDLLYGRDAGNWEVVEDGPATYLTVRKAGGGGGFDYENPLGTTANGYGLTNAHNIVLRPRSPAGLVGTPVAVTFTITDQDEEPDALTWAEQTNATAGQAYYPNLQQITGLAAGVSVMLTPQGGSKWGKGTSATPPAASSYTNTPFLVTNLDWVGPANTASASVSTSVIVQAKVSQVTFSYAVTTPIVLSTDTTFDPSNKGSAIVLTNGNRSVGHTGGYVWNAVRSTTAKSGHRYAELTLSGTASSQMSFGVCNAAAAVTGTYTPGYTDGNAVAWNADGGVGGGPTTNQVGSGTFAKGDVLGLEVDTTGVFKFYKNGALTITRSGGTPGSSLYLCVGDQGSSEMVGTLNTGQTAFAYSPPNGAQAWDV